MLTRTSGIIIPNTYPRIDTIKKDLNKKIYNWDDTITYMKLFYKNEDNSIIIPRFYPMYNEEIEDKSELGFDIDIKSNIVPRSERQEKSIRYLTTNDNGILKLEPGSGKTVIAIASIAMIKKKTIIFVHKLSLVKQWIEEITKFTNLEKEDIGLLTTKKYKEDLKHPIILSTVQCICSGVKKREFRDALLNSGIGVAIFDETHTTVGPEKFSLASLNINARRIYGLSATPYRYDVKEILNWHLGEVKYFEAKLNELLRPLVFMIYFNFKVFEHYKKSQYLKYDGRMQYSRYEKGLIKSEHYLDVVSSMIKKSFYEGKRKILVMGKQIKPLIEMAKKTEISKDRIGLFTPSATEEQMLSVSDTIDMDIAFKEKDIVFCTQVGGRDGNNREDLDCILLTSPCNNVEQAVGRICRSMQDKKVPIVIDFVDIDPYSMKVWSIYDEDRNDERRKIGIFERSAEKRFEFYKHQNWEIKKIMLK